MILLESQILRLTCFYLYLFLDGPVRFHPVNIRHIYHVLIAYFVLSFWESFFRSLKKTSLYLLSWTTFGLLGSDFASMALVQSPSLGPYSKQASVHTPLQADWSIFNAPPIIARNRTIDYASFARKQTDLASEFDGFHLQGIDALTTLNSIDTLSWLQEEDSHKETQISTTIIKESPRVDSNGSFRRWVRSINRRRKSRPTILNNEAGDHPWARHDFLELERTARSNRTAHSESSSHSSFNFISAVRSATISLASAATSRRSVRHRAGSRALSRTDRSSKASFVGPRASEESSFLEKSQFLDAVTVQRSLQRRRILEELVSTEESYIGDVRFLMNVSISARYGWIQY